MGKVIGAILFLIVVIVGASVFFGSFYNVDEGERAVLLRNGAFQSIEGPGLHYKTPFIDDVEYISTREQVRLFKGEEGVIESYSFDQQAADLQISVLFRVPEGEVQNLYTQYKSIENMASVLIDRKVLENTKVVFGQYTAVRAIQERGKLNKEVSERIIASIEGPVQVLSVQIEDIKFSPAYEASIEARMLAEVEVQKRKQELEQKKIEAEITVTEAQAKADSNLAIATADAEAIKVRGQAEASSIQARGQALRDNPALIGLIQAERWNGQLPTSMIPGGTVPFLNVAP